MADDSTSNIHRHREPPVGRAAPAPSRAAARGGAGQRTSVNVASGFRRTKGNAAQIPDYLLPITGLDDERQRLRLLAGLHGRKPESVFAWWQWKVAQANPVDAAIWRMAACLLERVGEVHAAVHAVLKCATVAETIRFFDTCVFLAEDLTPKKLTERWAAVTKLKSRYAKTADIADQLADMLEAQEDERARLGLDGPDVATSGPELFVVAGKNAPEFDARVSGGLQDLRRQSVGDKYWPTVSDLLRTLASAHRQVRPQWLSETTAAALDSKTRPGTFRGLFRAIGVLLAGSPGAWPLIKMPDKQVADFVMVLLGLPSDLSSKEQVKKTRKASAKSRSS